MTVVAFKLPKASQDYKADEPSGSEKSSAQNAAPSFLMERLSLYEGTLTDQEVRALASVVAYVASSQKISETTISCILSATFGARDVKSLKRDQFDDAVRYLLKCNFAGAIN